MWSQWAWPEASLASEGRRRAGSAAAEVEGQGRGAGLARGQRAAREGPH